MFEIDDMRKIGTFILFLGIFFLMLGAILLCGKLLDVDIDICIWFDFDLMLQLIFLL